MSGVKHLSVMLAPARAEAPSDEATAIAVWGDVVDASRPEGFTDATWDAFSDTALQFFDIGTELIIRAPKAGTLLATGSRGGETMTFVYPSQIVLSGRDGPDARPASLEEASWLDTSERKPQSPNRVQTAAEFVGELVARQWRVKALCPLDAKLAVFYGASGAGKSFFIDDAAIAVHRGTPWNGRRTTQGRVISIIAEGSGDFRYRRAAAAQRLGVSLAEMPSLIDNAPDLFNVAHADDVIAQIRAAGGCDVLIVDTLSATFSGDENAGKDLGVYLRNCGRIQRALGCAIWLCTHTGKDASKGARGWSGLRAAADVEVEVTSDGTARAASVTKMKGGSEGVTFGFRLDFVQLGTDEDGEQFGSCVVEHNDPATKVQHVTRARKRPKKGAPLIVLQVIETEFPNDAVHLDDLYEKCRPTLERTVSNPRRVKEYFREAVCGLADVEVNKFLYRHGDTVSLHSLPPTRPEPFE